MTPSQLLKLKKDFIEKRQTYMKGRATALQKKLYDKIFDKILNELKVSEGRITNDGRNIDLAASLDRIFNTFQTSEFTPVIAQFGKDLLKISNFNKEYFTVIADKHIEKVNTVAQKSKDRLKKNLGLTDNGVVKKGYLDKLINDPSLKKEVKAKLLKAITNKKPVGEFIKEMEKIVIGSGATNGALERHFDQFMRDTYTQADRTTSKDMAIGLGVRAFVYQGGKIKSSRCFCVENDNKVFTIEETHEWKELVNTDCGPVWSDNERAYNPLTDMGGHQCRHVADFISNAMAIRLRPDLKGKL